MISVSRARWLLAFFMLFSLLSEAAAQEVAGPPPWKARGRKYRVKIDSSPQHATIYLNDKRYGPVGYTPWTGRITRGDYKLIIELPGYKAGERMIQVSRRSREFYILLEKEERPGTIDIQAIADNNVLGAEVFVDGLRKGTAPIIVDVEAGRHLLEIKKEKFQDYTQWLNVKEGERVTISPVLKGSAPAAGKGSLLIDADVPGAEVWVDGKKHPDSTPTVIEDLDEGVHVIEVKKDPAVPWKQTVFVKGGQRTKVTATLSSTIQVDQGGNVRVLSNVEGAEVWLDGTKKGQVPLDLKDIPPGVHLIEVRAPGYASKEERVTVNAGSSTILKVDLSQGGEGDARVKVVSPVPEAAVFIDGANVGNVPVERAIPAGEHFVVVEKPGYAKFEKKVRVEPGQTITITAELRAVGTVRFLANVQGAEVVLDGEPIGKTPLVKNDINVGEHIVTIRKLGYYDFESPVTVKGGETANVNASLELIDTGPTPEEIARVKKGLSSFGARTMPYGRFTVDASAGYPYIIEARATVGVKDKPTWGWDAHVGFRSYLTTWEFLLGARFRLLERDPFTLGLFGTVGGGAGFNGRNMFTLQTGALGSITFRNIVTVTGRAYFDIWSDRLCGEPDPLSMSALPEDGPAVCTGKGASADDYARAGFLTGKTVNGPEDLQDRDNGIRFYLSLVVEAAVTDMFNFFLVFEGVPFQGERAAHTDLFNPPLFEEDPGYNGKLGITAKF